MVLYQQMRSWIPDSRRFEIIYGIHLAVFAALLAVFDLHSGTVGSEELKQVIGQNNAYQWYQAKSIKASLTKSQLEMTKLLHEASGNNSPQYALAVEQLHTKLSEYKREQSEILLGSAAVGPDKWTQKIEGQLGQVIGAKEYDIKLAELGETGDLLDRSVLYLQLSLVLGALGILMTRASSKFILLLAMFTCGVLGSFYGVQGLMS